MPATYEPIATYTFSSPALGYTFSNIPQTYDDLILVCNAQYSPADGSGYIGCELRFNGDGNANYDQTGFQGTGASTNAYTNTATTSMNIGGFTNNSWTTQIFDIIQYRNTSSWKTVLCRSGTGASGTFMRLGVGQWRNTAAVTSIFAGHVTLRMNTGTIFTLYGVKAA